MVYIDGYHYDVISDIISDIQIYTISHYQWLIMEYIGY